MSQKRQDVRSVDQEYIARRQVRAAAHDRSADQVCDSFARAQKGSYLKSENSNNVQSRRMWHEIQTKGPHDYVPIRHLCGKNLCLLYGHIWRLN